jgi:hypothetical protein
VVVRRKLAIRQLQDVCWVLSQELRVTIMGIRCFRFVVVLLCIYGPDIVFIHISGGDFIDCSHRCEHGVILIVVSVHSISANQEQIPIAIDKFSNCGKTIVTSEICRVSLWHANNRAIDNIIFI